jgi:SsrA-binding protein
MKQRAAEPPDRNERISVARNPKASHDFFILETVEAGIVLKGTEVKSLRAGKASIKEAWAQLRNGEVWLEGMHITPYEQGNRWNQPPLRTRKLLLHRREIDKLMGRSMIKGQTVVPLAVYLKGSWIKVELALAQGKKLYDKRRAEREKVVKRETEEALRKFS